MNPNRELHELFGHCWHEQGEFGRERPRGYKYICSCGLCCSSLSILEEHIHASNPDYAADPRMVIREMEKRKDGKLFFAKLIYAGDNVEAIDDDGLIDRDLILDTTGKLRGLAIGWMKEQKKGEGDAT